MNEQSATGAAPKGEDTSGEDTSGKDSGGEDSGARTRPARDRQSSDLHTQLSITRQYIKDLSFENPNAPAIFSAYGEEGPELKVSVDIAANAIEDNSHEVVLSLYVSATFRETAAFIVELQYAAQAVVDETVSEDKLERALMVEVPRYLFPFLRNIIANTTRDGGFPPLLLSPINFGKIHDGRRRQQRSETATETTATET
jgi:preprotein translocase subunit SecB